MANEIYINKGAELLVSGASSANVAWSMEGKANNTGQVSAQIDLGAAPRPDEFEWSCELQLQATPTQGAWVEFFKAAAPDSTATQIDGDIGQTDAALADLDMRKNLTYFGCVISENAAANEKCIASGRFRHTQRYLSLVGVNLTGATINATDTNFKFLLRPIYYQGQ